MQLEDILAKAESFGFDLGKIRLVHVDDEPFEIIHAREGLAQFVGSYRGFTDPVEAFEFITNHHGEIDFLVLDQFMARDLTRIEGYQGIDVLRKLVDRRITIPCVIYSGSHAKVEHFSIIEALNGTMDIVEYRQRVKVERRGNLAPVDFVAKSEGINGVLARIVGLCSMEEQATREGYTDFFSAFNGRSPPGARYDLAMLAYEKAKTLYHEAEKFAQRFAVENKEADFVDPLLDKRFSELILDACGFKLGIKYSPEQIVQFSGFQLSGFCHEFSRAYRSVLPVSTEDAFAFDSVNMLTLYMGSVHHAAKFTDLKQLMDYVHRAPAVKKAVVDINRFKHDVRLLGYELSQITRCIHGEGYFRPYNASGMLNSLRDKDITYLPPSSELSTKVFTDRDSLCLLIGEIVYNAEKAGHSRGIVPEVRCHVSECGFSELPDDAKARFRSYKLGEYNCPELAEQQGFPEDSGYVKISIQDNCGGFKTVLQTNIPQKAPEAGSSGQGLPLIINSQKQLFYSLEIINRPGEGATFNLYFLQAVKKPEQ